MLNLLDFDAAGLGEWLAGQGEKPFRARQLLRWIHRSGVDDFEQMSDIAKSLRACLAQQARVSGPRVLSDSIAVDGTRKWLLDVGAENAIETVFIPEEKRGTLCVSSQVGCALECAFCATARQGFNRNLSTAEIIGQLWHANRALRADDAVARTPTASPQKQSEQDERRVSNVVMMGMGEPLANYAQLIPALRLMLDDHAYGLSRRRVTVSTAGMVPAMDRLSEDAPVALAVSLHAANDVLRDQLVPLNRKYPLATLLAACQRYLRHAPRDFITFEYVMLAGVNDSDADARALIALTRDLPCKFNLIVFNPFTNSGFRRPAPQRVKRFQEILMRADIVTTVRKTRGDEIDAACGQLAGQVNDRTRRSGARQNSEALQTVAISPQTAPDGAVMKLLMQENV